VKLVSQGKIRPIGLVLGVGPNLSAVPGERRLGEHNGHVHEADSHHLTWGFRSDIGLTDRFTFILRHQQTTQRLVVLHDQDPRGTFTHVRPRAAPSA
jgi:hypothetical protein